MDQRSHGPSLDFGTQMQVVAAIGGGDGVSRARRSDMKQARGSHFGRKRFAPASTPENGNRGALFQGLGLGFSTLSSNATIGPASIRTIIDIFLFQIPIAKNNVSRPWPRPKTVRWCYLCDTGNACAISKAVGPGPRSGNYRNPNGTAAEGQSDSDALPPSTPLSTTYQPKTASKMTPSWGGKKQHLTANACGGRVCCSPAR